MSIAAAASGGPGWTDILTAIGTVGAAAVAVAAVAAAIWIALWTDRKSEERLKGERERSDRLLAEQRALEKVAVEDERAHGKAQLDEERRLSLEREQYAEAYAVQVAFGDRDIGKELARVSVIHRPLNGPLERPDGEGGGPEHRLPGTVEELVLGHPLRRDAHPALPAACGAALSMPVPPVRVRRYV